MILKGSGATIKIRQRARTEEKNYEKEIIGTFACDSNVSNCAGRLWQSEKQ